MIYDLIIVCFAQPGIDARTLNFARTSHELGLKTAIIGLQDDEIPYSVKGIDIHYVSVNQKNRMLFRWYEFIRKAGRLIKALDTDIVIAGDLYSLPVISKVFAKRYIYDSREVYSAMGPLAGHRFKQRIISEIEKYYSAMLNVIYTSGDLDTAYLKKHLTDKPEYFEIYNVPPLKPVDKSDLIREKFGIEKNKRIILYQGALLPFRGLLPVIDYIKKYDNDVFCITGYGEYEQRIKKIIKDDELEDRIFLSGKISYDKLHQWTCSADIGVALFEPVSFSYELSFPNKLFEYIMAQIPVLATDIKPIRQVYKRYDFGALIDREMKPDMIKEGLDYIETHYNEIILDIINASKEYCYENQREKIIKILNI